MIISGSFLDQLDPEEKEMWIIKIISGSFSDHHDLMLIQVRTSADQ
jgi:hypothetical protein